MWRDRLPRRPVVWCPIVALFLASPVFAQRATAPSPARGGRGSDARPRRRSTSSALRSPRHFGPERAPRFRGQGERASSRVGSSADAQRFIDSQSRSGRLSRQERESVSAPALPGTGRRRARCRQPDSKRGARGMEHESGPALRSTRSARSRWRSHGPGGEGTAPPSSSRWCQTTHPSSRSASWSRSIRPVASHSIRSRPSCSDATSVPMKSFRYALVLAGNGRAARAPRIGTDARPDRDGRRPGQSHGSCRSRRWGIRPVSSRSSRRTQPLSSERCWAAAPFAGYRNYFNIWRVDLASNESGASHPNMGITRDTALGAYYNCGGGRTPDLRRLPPNSTRVLTTLPAIQRDFVGRAGVNDPEYGGSGGNYSVVSTVGQFAETLLHEHGHTLGQTLRRVRRTSATGMRRERADLRERDEDDHAIGDQVAVVDRHGHADTDDDVDGQTEVPGLFQGARLLRLNALPTDVQLAYAFECPGVPRRERGAVDPKVLHLRRSDRFRVAVGVLSPVNVNSGQSQTFTVTTPGAGRPRHECRMVARQHACRVVGELRGFGGIVGWGGIHDLQVIVNPIPHRRCGPIPQGVLTGTVTWKIVGPGMESGLCVQSRRGRADRDAGDGRAQSR